ncbi:sugar transporter SWEET1 isoform X2 [Anthonomus grandis grandis]|nr:sugar transporter SWEET1 isoform X2 [Anthonomus grandis grandis]
MTDMHVMYARAYSNCYAARRLYAEAFPQRQLADSKTFESVDRRLRERGSFKIPTNDRGRPRSVRTHEFQEAVLRAVEQKPGVSTRTIAARLGDNHSNSTVWPVLPRLQFCQCITCQKIVINKSSGEISSFPFVSGCLSTSLWLRYGFLIEDTSIILVNTIGVSLFTSYVVVFLLYSIKKTHVLRQFLFCLLVLTLVLMRVHRILELDIARNFLGKVCLAVTILFFAAPFASLLEVFKVKSTESLPYHLIVSTFIVSLQWMIYGILLNDKFIQIPNLLGCILSAIQLSLFLIYPSKTSSSIYSNI